MPGGESTGKAEHKEKQNATDKGGKLELADFCT